jgi:hypothetical protein
MACPKGKRILMTYLPARWGATWLPHGCLEQPECASYLEMNWSCKSQWHSTVQRAAKITRLNSVQLLMRLYKRYRIVPPLAQSFQSWDRKSQLTQLPLLGTLHKVLHKLDCLNTSCMTCTHTMLCEVCPKLWVSPSTGGGEVPSMPHLFSVPF